MAEFAQILIRAKDETKTAFDSAARNMRGLEASAAKLGGLLRTVGLGAGISVAGFAAFAKTGIDAADALNDMSQRLGVSVKDLASFKLAAEQSGTSLDGVGNGIARLSRSIGEAEGGNKKLAETLRTLGITARDPKEAFFQLAEATQRIQDPAQRAALLSQVLGKSYQELVPLLNQGGDALRESARQSESFADSMSRLAPDADRFNDQLAQLKINASGFGASVLVDVVPALNEFVERIVLVKDLIGAGGLFNTLGITAGTSEISTVMRRLKDDIRDTQDAIAGEKAKGKDASPFEDKLRALNAQLEVMKANSRSAALALADQFGNYKMPGTPAQAGSIKLPASGSSKAKAIDKADIFNDETARNAKLVADETDRIAGDLSFMAQVDLAQNNPIAAMGQEWVEAGRALKQDMMTPLEKFDGRLEYINELWRIGAIDIETYDRAMASAFDDAGAKIEQTNDMAREFGLTMQSAFEDAVIEGKGFRDILGGIGADLQRMVMRKTITEPLGNAVSGFIDGIDFGSMFGFANGGVMGSAGPLPLHAYARGGVASSPQLALFGEGRMNEAFVPLPDGRRIPVDMRGGGGGNVQVNIIESPGNGGKTERRQDGNGGNVLDIYVEQIKASIAGDISRGRGAVPDALAGTYGLNRVAGAY